MIRTSIVFSEASDLVDLIPKGSCRGWEDSHGCSCMPDAVLCLLPTEQAL